MHPRHKLRPLQPLNHYELLGVHPSASKSEIKKAYRRIVKKFHPDTSIYVNAHEMFLTINEAYKTLKDDKKRSEYDTELRMKIFEEQVIEPIKKKKYAFDLPDKYNMRDFMFEIKLIGAILVVILIAWLGTELLL